MTIVFIISLAVIIIWRWKNRNQTEDGRLGRVLGEAHEYDECPSCSKRNSQEPRGRGEVITRGGAYVVRQYHVCLNCNVRALWHRRLDLWVWTVTRSGVAS